MEHDCFRHQALIYHGSEDYLAGGRSDATRLRSSRSGASSSRRVAGGRCGGSANRSGLRAARRPWKECRRHEALLNVAFDSGPAWDLLCPYDAASLDDEVLAKVAHSHPVVCRDGEHEESSAFVLDPDCFAGELPPPAATPEMLSFELTRPDISREGGRGLWLANRLCDLVQIRSGEHGTTVRLHVLAREVAYV